MKSRLMMVAAMLGLLATACNKDEVTPQDDMTTKTPVTINASYGSGNNGSKVQYTESGSTISATWQSGDQLLVIYNNNVNTLTLSTGAGTSNATFTGSISGTPSEGAMLVCYVKDQNTPNGTITVNGDGSYIYTSDAFLGQDGTLASAAKLNLYCGWTRYSSTSDINCSVGVNTSMMKFTVSGISDDAGSTASIAYKSAGTEIAKASFTVAAGENTIYLTIPAGQYTGEQSLFYTCGGTEMTYRLSATQANFTAGQTYSKDIEFYNARNYPLTFEAVYDYQTVSLSGGENTINLEYSLNGGAWTPYTKGATITLVNTGDKVSFRGNNTTINSSTSSYSSFGGSGSFYVYGNIMSLLSSTGYSTATILSSNYTFAYLFSTCTGLFSHPSKELVLPATTLTQGCYQNMFEDCTMMTSAPKLPATTLANKCYYWMFAGCDRLTTAPTLPATALADGCYQHMFLHTGLTTAPALPATTLAENCYYGMFKNCTGLVSAPALPATILAYYCYFQMFSGCTNLHTAPTLPATTLANHCYDGMFAGSGLTSAPSLPATTLANGCYYEMFVGCTGLTTAPLLPATTLATGCYGVMFSGCTNLSNVTCLATDISAPNCTANWLYNVSATGTFTKASSMSSWETGTYGIPAGWTVNNQ